MEVWECGSVKEIFESEKLTLLNANKYLEISEASMGVWEYGSK